MSGALQAVLQNQRSFGVAPDSQAYTSPGTYTWVAPTGVTTVSVVAIGGGGGGTTGSSATGGSGGGLGYKNNYSVTPGSSYTVVVGGVRANSYFVSVCVVKGGAGPTNNSGAGGSFTGDGGGTGGFFGPSGSGGGGGAGGYSGQGGAGGNSDGSTNATSGSGGGGGGGQGTGGGGGVGIYGQGSNGAARSKVLLGTGAYASRYKGLGGGGGSGGANGGCASTFEYGCCGDWTIVSGSGGAYGGGAGQTINNRCVNGQPGTGAVRIVWPGNTRTFPSTCVGLP